MSAPRRPNRTPAKKEIPNLKPKAKPPKEWTPIRKLIAVVMGLATLLGVPAAVIAFWPRMIVTPSGLFDESNAYSETFTVANTGFLPFENVLIGIGICSIETTKKDFAVTANNCTDDSPRLLIGGGPSWTTQELRRDEPFSVILSDVLTVTTDKYRAEHPNEIGGFQMMSPLKAANIIVVVVFSPWPSSTKIVRKFRFVAEEQPNNKMMWRGVPLSWKAIKLPE